MGCPKNIVLLGIAVLIALALIMVRDIITRAETESPEPLSQPA